MAELTRGSHAGRRGTAERVTGVVLAGGLSRRMGTDKALLDLAGRPLVARVVDGLRAVFSRLLCVTNDPDRLAFLGVPTAGDLVPGAGPLGGIHAALRAARTDAVFVAACDMPFLNPELVRYLVAALAGHDAAVPRWGDHLEPLHACYSRACLPAIEARLAAGRFKVDGWFGQVRLRVVGPEEVRRLDPEGLSFFNANTPEEYLRALALWHRQP